jgi:hypothetical protein
MFEQVGYNITSEEHLNVQIKGSLVFFRSGVYMPLLSLSLTLIVCPGTRFSISIVQPHSLLYLILSILLVTHKFGHSSNVNKSKFRVSMSKFRDK